MRVYSNVYDCNIYLFAGISLFAHFKQTVKIYAHNFTPLLKISINNHTLLYIRTNTHKYIW